MSRVSDTGALTRGGAAANASAGSMTHDAIKKAAKPPKEDKGARGRKDADGQEMVPQPKVLAEAMDELEVAYKKQGAAVERFSDMVKKVAKASGLLASVVKKVVKARCDDNFAAKQREYEQLSLIFAEIGED